MPQVKPPIILGVTGPKGCGKSTLIERLSAELASVGASVGGVISLSHIYQGRRVGYDLFTLPDRQRELLAVESSWANALLHTERLEHCSYSFSAAAVEKGRRALAAAQGCDCLLIDEVGFWELSGGGWSQCMGMLAGRKAPTVLGLRREIIPELGSAWGIELSSVIDLEKTSSEQAFETLSNIVTRHSKGDN